MKIDRNLFITILLSSILVIVFYILALKRYEAFFSYEWEDLAWNNGFLKNVSLGNWQNLKSTFYNSYSKFHISPIYVLLGFLYGAAGSIKFIFFYSSLSVYLAAIPIYLIAKEKLQDSNFSFLIALSYLLYAPKNNLIFLDGDAIILCISLIPWAVYFGIKKNHLAYISSLVLIAFCRTETPLVAAFICLYALIPQWLQKKPLLRSHLYLFIFFSFWTVLSLALYSRINNDVDLNSTLSLSVFDNPLGYLMSKLTLDKLQPLAVVLLYVACIPLVTLEMLIAIPTFILLFISPNFSPQKAHYFSILIPVMFISLTSIFKPALNSNRKLALKFMVGFILITFSSNFLPNIIGELNYGEKGSRVIQDKRFLNVNNLYSHVFYTADNEDIKAVELIKLIPPNASVTASGDLLPQISSREYFNQILDPKKDYLKNDYIISKKHNMYFGAGAYKWDQGKFEKLILGLKKNKEWILLYEDENFILLKKEGV